MTGKIARKQFPAGRDGQVLVLDTSSPNGIAWRSGVDRLVTDITPELSGDLDCQTFKVTDMGTPSASTDAATKGYVDTAVGAAPLTRAFWHGYKTLALHTLTGLTKGADNWVTTPSSWTAQEAEEWSESSGEWSYAGDFPASGKRYFRVNYHFAIDGYASANWWRMQGRVTHTPNGGAAAVVPGSIMSSTPYAYYAIFGVTIQHHHVSGSCIVEMAHAGDTISFQYGNYVTGAGTFTAGNLITRDSGLSLTITPADINP